MEFMNEPLDFATGSDENHQLFRMSDYIILNKLGRGSYGRVYLAKNKKNKYLYALKKVKIDKGVPASTLREVGLLKILQHPNIVSFHQLLINENKCYMVLEYMLMSLDIFIKENEITAELRQSFMFQLLQAMLFCHNRNVLHRDIKSQNILVHHTKTVVKLSDFGLSRKVPILPSRLSPNVVTLYYRSPELLLNDGHYSSGIDIWSLGCVFVEMVLKHVPFRVDGEIELYNSWFRQLGVPTEEDMPGVVEKFNLMKFAGCKNSNNDIKTLKETVDPLCYDLITKMFIYNPLKRIDACEALHHEYFQSFDASVVPAINEENVGYPGDYLDNLFPRKPQVLYLTAENVATIPELVTQEDISLM